jgi:hypothetical protein
MYRKILVAGLATFATTVALAAPAMAAVPSDETYVGGTANQLRTHSYNGDGTRSTCSKITAQNTRKVGGTDSPNDTNRNVFTAHVCDGGYIIAYTDASLDSLTGMKVSDLTNIGFDFKTADVTGAGQVYIAIVLESGEVLFLDAAHCSTVIPGTAWSTTHFDEVGAANCTIYDQEGNAYSASSTMSALDAYQAAHPDALVDYTYIGVFGVDGTKDVHLDRIRLGTDYVYDYSKLYAHKLAA